MSAGRAAWLDKGNGRAMVLWKSHAEWADTIYEWARSFGLNDSVMTIDELSGGDDVESTGVAHCSCLPVGYLTLQQHEHRGSSSLSLSAELEGLPREIIVPALKILEGKGLAR